jgi:uncharacterized protein YndB with AHSA1/START domain
MSGKLKFPKVGRVSAESVAKGTGKNWDEWVRILTDAGAQNFSHKDIVQLLTKKYKLSLWWQQGVATGYEIAIGKKIEGRNDKGEYSMAATKTFPIDQKSAWKILTSKRGIDVWLRPLSQMEIKPKRTFETENGVFGEVRTLKAPHRIRIRWNDTDWEKPSSVMIVIIFRPAKKCVVAIQHEKLTSNRIKTQMREHWKNVLNELTSILK